MSTLYKTSTKLSWLVLCCALVFLSSCKKEDQSPDLTIQGRILDSTSGGAVPSATVRLSQKVLSDGTFSSIFEPIATVNSSSSGRFEFTFPREAATEFRLEVSRGNYFNKTVSINPDNVNIGTPYDLNVGIAPEAWFRWRLFNESPLSSQDAISFELLNANFMCECCSNELQSFQGTNVNASEKCLLQGNYNLKYRYSVLKDIFNYTVIDSVVCAPFDTTLITVNY